MEISKQQYWAQKQVEREQQAEAERTQTEAQRQAELAEVLAKKYDITPFFMPNKNAKKLKPKIEYRLACELKACRIIRQSIEIDNLYNKVVVKVIIRANGREYLCYRDYKISEFEYANIPVSIGGVFDNFTLTTESEYSKMITEAECMAELNFEEDQRGKRQYENLESSM